MVSRPSRYQKESIKHGETYDGGLRENRSVDSESGSGSNGKSQEKKGEDGLHGDGERNRRLFCGGLTYGFTSVSCSLDGS